MNKDFRPAIEGYLSRLKATIDLISREELQGFLTLLMESLEAKRRIYVMGNGGSAATASHYVADFNKGLSLGKAQRFRFHCLNDNLPTLTAYANDLSYDDVYVEPLKNFLETGDLVIAISGSGNSRNVLKAIEYANGAGAITLGITGYDGGKLRKIAQRGLHVPINDMQVVEDLHMVFDHLAYAVLGAVLPLEGGAGASGHG